MTEIRGTVAPGFEKVRDAFENNFAEHGEVGAGFCVYVDGQPVVELTGGIADQTGRPYDDDTLQLVFSTTKGATAICAHLLAQRGELDLDAPVAEYWPEFAANGKDNVPVSWLLRHRSGLIDTTAALSFEAALDWDTVTAALAETVPWWEPGTRHGYHAVTYGWLVGEVVRRISGKSLGTFFHDEVAAPLGLDFWIGLPPSEQSRVAPLIPMGAPSGISALGAEAADAAPDASPGNLTEMLAELLGPDNFLGKALAAPGGAFANDGMWNLPEVRAAEIPAANGVTNVASLARMYAGLIGEVDGTRILSKETIERAIVPQVEGPDAVLMVPIPWALGFMRHCDFSPLVGGSSFGHYGAGGSLGFADPDRGLACGYVMNRMHLGLAGDPRTAALLSTVDRAVG